MAHPGYALPAILAMGLYIPVASALTLTPLASLSLGAIEYASNPANGNITMGTNGTITYGPSFSGTGTGTAGQVLLDDAAGTIVDIRCSDTSTLATGAHTLTALHAIVIGSANVGAYPSAMPCQGLGTTVTTYTLAGTPAADTVYLAAQLNTNGQNLVNGSYNTINAGGTSPAVSAIVQ